MEVDFLPFVVLSSLEESEDVVDVSLDDEEEVGSESGGELLKKVEGQQLKSDVACEVVEEEVEFCCECDKFG